MIGYAFDAAARHTCGLRVVHGRAWPRPACSEQARDLLTGILMPWQEKSPGGDVYPQPPGRGRRGGPRRVDASRDARLAVVGRGVRRSSPGPRVGPVTHAVLHHAHAPVAVVPHD
ncbi:universal stress protein [Streptomyces sp. V3I8]|uniref:universal stress protein n=1 Tax=Streptomyces sp. V3I8 TaxID=3042279 RepID=UPI003594931D